MFTILAYTIIILTTIWVLIDAERLKIPMDPKKPYSAMNGSVGFLVGCLVLWIVIVPVYLVKRARTLRERGLKSTGGTVFGVVAVAAWIACVLGAIFIPQRLSTDELRDYVSTRIENFYQKTPATKNIHLKSLSLARESGNEYKGVAALDIGGKPEQHVVNVTYDGTNVKWQLH